MGISQEKLAERAGLRRTYLSDVERGARNVSLSNIEKLAAALQVSASTLLAYPRGPGAPGPDAEPPPADGLADILLVEDRMPDVELALRALKQAAIANRIQVAHDGAAALDFLFHAGGQTHRPVRRPPQLILLELNLPKVDGLEVLRRIKADARTRAIPVVVLTASKQDARIAAGRRLGAAAHIVKPVGFHSLVEVTPRLSLQWGLLPANSQFPIPNSSLIIQEFPLAP